jgi:phosphohistidine swiveling domain-containing protein
VSFNTLTPDNLPPSLKEDLLDHYLEKLAEHPELQDKVEFDIVFTCFDLTFEERARELRHYGFSNRKVAVLREGLAAHTNMLLQGSDGIIARDMALLEQLPREALDTESILAAPLSPQERLRTAYELLADCRNFGTVPFSRLARLAFIGMALLKSLLRRGTITQEFYDSFLGGLDTVASGLGNDVSSLASGHLSLNAFLRRYGHLRAGTYNILTPRYDQIPDLFRDLRPSLSLDHAPAPLSMTSRQVTRITSDLLKSGIQCSGEALLRFIKQTLELRESSKFEFTRALSAALEHIAIAGSDLGLSREQIASVDLDSLLAFRGPAGVDPQRIHDTWVASAVAGSEEQRLYRRLALPPVLTSGRDLVAAMDYSSRPNFVTQKVVRGAIAELNDIDYANVPQLRDKIVLLENADPGYDWIFTRHPLGLLTKYGGVASHMAIRCAELGVPAALGCGGALFDRIKAAGVVTLDCATQSIALV